MGKQNANEEKINNSKIISRKSNLGFLEFFSDEPGAEIKKAYKFKRKIGKGATAIVYEGKHKKSGKETKTRASEQKNGEGKKMK